MVIVKIDLDLSNKIFCKIWLKNKRGADTSDFAKKTDLTNLKLDVDKLKNVPCVLNSLKST